MARTAASNFSATTLTANVGTPDLIFDVVSTFSMTGNAYLVIDPRNADTREVILAEVTSSTRFTCDSLSDRYLDGSAETSGLAHDSGTEVWSIPVAQVVDDIWTAIEATETVADAAYTPGGTDVAVADGGTGASTAAGARTNLSVSEASHTHDSRYYTESETDDLLDAKVASSDITTIDSVTQAAYDELDPPDANTLYLIPEA